MEDDTEEGKMKLFIICIALTIVVLIIFGAFQIFEGIGTIVKRDEED